MITWLQSHILSNLLDYCPFGIDIEAVAHILDFASCAPFMRSLTKSKSTNRKASFNQV